VFVLGCQPLDPASLNASDEVAARITAPTCELVAQLDTVLPLISANPLSLVDAAKFRNPAGTGAESHSPQFAATRHDMAKLAPPSHSWLPVPRLALRESGIRAQCVDVIVNNARSLALCRSIQTL
jgi:hypothetical protein